MPDARPETVAASHGVASDDAFGAVCPPLYLSTTFAFEGYAQPRAYDYGRAGNPNRAMLGEALARLEGGAGAVVTCSGMAAIAARQQEGFGAMLSFELDGDAALMKSFLEALRVFTLAESLGGVESLAAHPATMTHADMGPEARRVAGISDSLVRLSVGLEHADDLLADLRQALG